MNGHNHKFTHHLFFRIFSLYLIVAFTINSIILPGPSYAQMVSGLPAPGHRVTLSSAFHPAIIKGLTINPDNPLLFDFIVDRGNSGLKGKALEEESKKLVKYFLTALTIPDNDVWVNLSPYEQDRVVPQPLGVTEMGKDMLAQDYLLKQLTASLTHPEDRLGKKFWEKVNQRAYELYGTTKVPVNTFNKVWIVPEKAVVFEQGATAFVAESHLQVMLEKDYLAMTKNLNNNALGTERMDQKQIKDINDISSAIVREVIIPELEKEINEGKNFAPVRQIYHSVILASWYKETLKESLLGKIYVNQNKTAGVDVDDKEIKRKIYEQYLAAFKEGVYNLIKEDYDISSQDMFPRKYFSGGLIFKPKIERKTDMNDLAPEVQQEFLGIARNIRETQTRGPGNDSGDSQFLNMRVLSEEAEVQRELEERGDFAVLTGQDEGAERDRLKGLLLSPNAPQLPEVVIQNIKADVITNPEQLEMLQILAEIGEQRLLAILLRTGTAGTSAVELSRKILGKFGSFRSMAHTDTRDWKEFKGLGGAKIAHIQAALEIGRRYQQLVKIAL